jgi:hypothetical protein
MLNQKRISKKKLKWVLTKRFKSLKLFKSNLSLLQRQIATSWWRSLISKNHHAHQFKHGWVNKRKTLILAS